MASQIIAESFQKPSTDVNNYSFIYAKTNLINILYYFQVRKLLILSLTESASSLINAQAYKDSSSFTHLEEALDLDLPHF